MEQISRCYSLIIDQRSQNPQISVTTIGSFVLRSDPEPVITQKETLCPKRPMESKQKVSGT